MSLLNALARAKTEEDVKDAYIKALGDKLSPQVFTLGFLPARE